MYFQKLRNKFYFKDISIKDEIVYYGFKSGDKVFGLKYSQVESYNRDLILSVIPERYQDSCLIMAMEVNSYVPPHTDSKIKTTINFYITPDECQTNFYSKIPNIVASETKTINQTNGSMFNLKDLNLESSFVATPGDAYILNVTHPHAVKPKNLNVYRLALCLQFTEYSYDQVLDMLKETNNL